MNWRKVNRSVSRMIDMLYSVERRVLPI
jgi:hypothetical protein